MDENDFISIWLDQGRTRLEHSCRDLHPRLSGGLV